MRIDLVDQSDPFGEVIGGYLIVSGLVRSLRSTPTGPGLSMLDEPIQLNIYLDKPDEHPTELHLISLGCLVMRDRCVTAYSLLLRPIGETVDSFQRVEIIEYIIAREDRNEPSRLQGI